MMKHRGFKTTYQLAKATGVPVQTLDKIVEGNQGISYKKLDVLCEVLECEVGELIEHVRARGKKHKKVADDQHE